MTDSSTGGYLLPTSTPLVEDAALDVLLQNLVVGVTGMTPTLVRPRWQQIAPAEPEVGVDWCAIGITEEMPDPQGGNISNVHSSDGHSTTVDVSILTILSSFYGPNARQNAQNMRVGLMIPQNREVLYFNDLSLMEQPGGVTFAPSLVGQQTQRRADVSFRLRRAVTMTWAIENIVEMAGDIKTDNLPDEPIQTPTSLDPLTE